MPHGCLNQRANLAQHIPPTSLQSTTCSSNMSDMPTIVSSSETNASPRLRHTRSCWMTVSTENLSSLKLNQIKNSLDSCLETKPLELIYQGPTHVSQVLSPFSASPPTVLLSGFRSRCHIVIKGAFPSLRVQQGLSQLIRLYTRAGFPNEELQSISNQLLIQHQNSSAGDQICCGSRLTIYFCFLVVPGLPLPSVFVWLLVVLFLLSLGGVALVSAFGSVCVVSASCSLSLCSSFLAQLSLSPSFILGVDAHGSCSRPCVSPPPGSGNYASQLLGGALTLFRAVH